MFLPKGVDTCFDLTNICYSPDNPPSFVFCAYHGSVTFSDIGHVLITVEPFQNVNGCSVATPSPNGALVDSTANVLSHELFESITDPDPPGTVTDIVNGKFGWIALNSLIEFGAEIGDICEGPFSTTPRSRSMVRVMKFSQNIRTSSTAVPSCPNRGIEKSE